MALRALDEALKLNHPVVQRHVRRMRRSRPDASPAEIVRALEKQLLAATISLGAAAGASAAIPGVTALPAVGVNLAEVGSFLEAGTLFALSVAEVHGIQVDELERRRTLLMAVLMGSGGSSFIERAAGRTGPYWARNFIHAVPMTKVNAINKVLGPRFVTKYGTKQGILILGRQLPLGIGAVIGGTGNALLAAAAITGSRKAFGPPPATWPPIDGED